MILLQSDMTLFVGRLHPLVVHLPIGFLLLAALFFYLSRKEKFEFLKNTLPITLGLTALSAIVSVTCGWLLAAGGGFDPDTLFWHRWLGVLFTMATIGAWIWSFGEGASIRALNVEGWTKIGRNLPAWIIVSFIILISITGHLGGTLTHGETYLIDPAPSFIRNLFLDEEDKNLLGELPVQPDSILVYNNIIAPILISKCGNCHNDSQRKGGLNLLTVEGLEEGGDDGAVYVANKPFESALLLRTTMPPGHTKFMPPNGDPLSFSELELLRWWIRSGASFDQRLAELKDNSTLAILLKRDYGLDSKVKPVFEIIEADAVSDETLGELSSNGLIASYLYSGNNYLDVRVSPDIKELSLDQLRTILSVSDQVTWLDLNGVGIGDEHLEIIGELKMLTRLRLHSNNITDDGLPFLSELKYLESINLYNTKVSDAGLKALNSISTLKSLYLWKTEVTSEGAEQLKQELPNLVVDLGVNN